MLEQVFKNLVAFALRQFVYPLGKARIAVEHSLAGNRIRRKQWVNHRRRRRRRRRRCSSIVGGAGCCERAAYAPELFDVLDSRHAVEVLSLPPELSQEPN